VSTRKVVIAATSFSHDDFAAMVGKHPAVIAPGVVRQGTRLFADDPIVLQHPTLFVVASVVPDPAGTFGALDDGAPVPARPSGPQRVAIVRAYRGADDVRPSQARVAEAMGISEEWLRLQLRKLDVASWHVQCNDASNRAS